MCTLTLAWRLFPEAPVVVAANRDEATDRPSEPPGELEPGVVGPRDVKAGGTWIGYNEDDLFVGITNRWVEGLPAGRSRGLLVRDCLRKQTADEAASFVEESCAANEYDGFNLVLADETDALLLEWDGTLRVTELRKGVSVVGNAGFNGTYYDVPGRENAGKEEALNARRLAEHLRAFPDETAAEWVERAGEALGDHDFGVCIHDPEENYGTRSSSLIVLGADGSRRYDFADGSPCTTEYETVVETGATDSREGQS